MPTLTRQLTSLRRTPFWVHCCYWSCHWYEHAVGDAVAIDGVDDDVDEADHAETDMKLADGYPAATESWDACQKKERHRENSRNPCVAPELEGARGRLCHWTPLSPPPPPPTNRGGFASSALACPIFFREKQASTDPLHSSHVRDIRRGI